MNTQPDFKAKLKYRTTEEGGRQGYAASGYRPHVEFDHIPFFKSSGQQVFIDKETVSPGETVTAEITLLSYFGYYGNINEGDSFKFWEGAIIIGKGEITKNHNDKLKNLYTAEEKETFKKRFETAIELAREHKTIPVQNKHIGFNEKGRLRILGFSKWTNFNSITKERALEEIEELKNVYAHWLGLTNTFRELNGWLRPEYELSYSDGKNGIRICKVHEDKVDWMIE